MRTGLVSYRCENKDIQFNMSRIEKALRETQGKVDLLCFPEAFLQGFDSLDWIYETDQDMAVSMDSQVIESLKQWTAEYKTALLTGYIEKENDTLYSSCIVIKDGIVVHNYRRISRGWKEYSITDHHYKEGTETKEFKLFDKDIMIALCGDLWEHPERFKTDHLLIWPVYVSYTPQQWQQEELDAYAKQAVLASQDVLMINPVHEPDCHGGSCYFHKGSVIQKTQYGQEEILIVDIS